MDFSKRPFQRDELSLLAAGTSIVFALAVIVQALSLELNKTFYLLDILPVVFVLITIIYSLKTQEILGGEVGRSMSLVAGGLFIYGLTFHLINLPYQAFGNPTVYNISSSFFLTATHALQIFGISIATYGFYTVWRESQ